MDDPIIAAIVAILMGIAGVLGAIAVYIRSRAGDKEIKEERATTKIERDKEIQDLQVRLAVAEAKNADLEKKHEAYASETNKRLQEGDDKFDRVDGEFKEMNKLLGIIVGKLDVLVSMKERSHTPEGRPL